MKAIVTKYHGPSGARGSRISATAEGGNRVTIPYPHEIRGIDERHRAAAEALCAKKGWSHPERLVKGMLPDGKSHVFVWPDDGPARAADEMLAACKLLVAAYGSDKQDGEEDCGDSVRWEDLDAAHEAARQAIAKAEGRAA